MRWAEMDFTVLRRRPDETAALEALRKNAGPLRVPPDDLDQVTAPAAEREQMPGKRILLEHLLGEPGKAVEALAQVSDAGCQPDLR